MKVMYSSAASPTSGDLNVGRVVTFTLAASEAVTATGTSLSLSNGATAPYASGSGSSTVTYSYTVASGQDTTDLTATALNGTIADGAGNALANAGLTTIDTHDIIDTVAPTATSINTVGSALNKASSDQFTVTFSEAVTGVAASDFTVATTTNPDGVAVSDSGITVAGSGTTYTVTVKTVTGDGTLGLNLNANATGIVDAAGNALTAPFTGPASTVEHTPKVATVSAFVANQAALDLWLPGIVIDDTAANVVSALDFLNGDSHINAITLTDAGTPTLTLTVAEALDDTAALHAITNSPIRIVVADTAADLEALTPAQINSLATLGVTSVVSTDASVYFDWFRSAALLADGIMPIAPAGDIAHEGFANGAALSWLFGQGGTVDSLLTRAADGAFDVHHYQAAGVFQGVTYASSDIAFSATGVREAATYYAVNGDVASSVTFSANGGFTLTTPGEPTKSKSVDADGGYEYAYSGVTGQAYSADQSGYTSANTFVAHSQDNVGGGSGRVNILGDNLVIAATSGTVGPSTATGDFTFTPHASELFAIVAGAADDVFAFGSTGFGVDVINNFGLPGATTDSLNLSALFTGYNDLLSHTVATGANLLITDHVGDTISLMGVSLSALTAQKMGF